MLALLLALALGAVPDDLAQAIAALEADKVAVAAAQAKLNLDAAALEAIFHKHYPAPGPQPSPVASHKVEIVMVGGLGCAPCILMRPVIDDLVKEGVAVTEVAADSPAGQGWHVTATPTFIMLCDGKELTRSVGTLTSAQLRTWWADTLSWVAKRYPK